MTASTSSTVGGTIADFALRGSRMFLAGLWTISRSLTASLRIAEKIRNTVSTVVAARTSARPRTHAWTALGRIEASGRSPNVGSMWLRR